MINQDNQKEPKHQLGAQEDQEVVKVGKQTSIHTNEWQPLDVGQDRSSFMRCGGGSYCNEPK